MNFKLKNECIYCRYIHEISSYFYILPRIGKQRTSDNIMIILN